MILLSRGGTRNSITNDTATTLLAISVISATVIFTSYLKEKYEENKKKSNANSKVSTPTTKSLPLANVGILEVATKLGRPEGPFFLVEIAKKVQMQKTTTESCSFCNSFRLPFLIPSGNVYMIGDYKIAQKILLDPKTERPRFMYKSFQGPLEKTLFTSSTDDLAKITRKNVAHAFAKIEVKRMNAIALKQLETWLNKRMNHFVESGQPFDPALEIVYLTFSVILEAAFEYEATEEDFQFFSYHAESFSREFAFEQMANPLRKIFGAFIPSVRRATANAKKWLEFARKVLKAYRDNPNKSSSSSGNTTLIKIFAEATWFESEAQRESEMIAWIFAGMDTTGYTISNTLTLLAKHPEEQTKVREALLRHPDKIATEVPEFHYMMQETKRILPVAAMGSMRQTGRDIIVTPHLLREEGKEETDSCNIVSAVKIPEGAVCFFPLILLTRNPNVFGNDSEVFRPGRWEHATKAMEDSIPYFSLGPRNCPGQLLAVAEMNTILPRILKEYSLELVEEGIIDYFITLKSVGSKLRASKVN